MNIIVFSARLEISRMFVYCINWSNFDHKNKLLIYDYDNLDMSSITTSCCNNLCIYVDQFKKNNLKTYPFA